MNTRFLAAVTCLVITLATRLPATAACTGDCDGAGEVTADELLLGVGIALGGTAADRCGPIDASGDGAVTIDEIIGAVNIARTACPAAEPRLVALSRDGKIAALDLAAPWALRASGDLHATIASARCRAGYCLVAHPSPADTISIVNTADLSFTTMALERDADPRDVALLDDGTVVVSQYGKAELLVLDPVTHAPDTLDLSGLADADGLPEALRMATCGRRVFVQLRRVDHETGVPAASGAALAVIDLDRTGNDRVVDADPATPGVQGIALAGRPNFDMPVDCAAGLLYVVEPAPVLQGGSRYETVDLGTLTADDWPVESSAEAGGVEVISAAQYWLITHTDFGPGASSHLNFVGGSTPDTYNTFANEHVDDLALDRPEDLLFFPDPCTPSPANASCDTGIHIFHAHTGTLAAATAIKTGFGPIEVVVSR